MNAEAARWYVLFVVVLIAGGGVYYQYQNTRPCVHPVPYAIGTIDSRFGITENTLLSDAKVSAAIWNTAAGKQVLVYDPKAALKINLIYDEREATAKLGNSISTQQVSTESARVELDALQVGYRAAQTAYNQKVSAINARGGATKSEAKELEVERAKLKVLADSIDRKVANYNATIAALNAQAGEFNKSAGQTFEAGQYVRDAKGERITIYEFIGTDQLERVLTHEFGHAIGLGHNTDSNSIMYAKSEDGNLVPSPTDLADLTKLCGLKTS